MRGLVFCENMQVWGVWCLVKICRYGGLVSYENTGMGSMVSCENTGMVSLVSCENTGMDIMVSCENTYVWSA